MAHSRLGVRITADRINNFFSIIPKNEQSRGTKGTQSRQGQVNVLHTKHRVGITNRKERPATSPAPRTPSVFGDDDVFDIAWQEEFKKLQLENVEESLTPVAPIISEHGALEIYDNYSFGHQYDQSLPITEHKQQVLETIESGQVTIIQGATGSGKTTQVPQYILDYYYEQRKYCNILVTQPRRIAAVSIAKRVCHERNWPVGTLVGYQVARDKQVSEDTRITFMTTGVLLQKLIKNKSMDEFTHIILDEVHERDQDIDFSMLVVRKFMRSVSKHIKVILMSATAETDLYSHYFSILIRGQLEGAPAVSVEGKLYDVKEYYLEHLRDLYCVSHLDISSPDITEERYLLARRIIKELDNQERLRSGIADKNRFVEKRGTVLVFLPGLQNIREMTGYLDDIRGDLRLEVIPLHSQITDEEQSKVFLKPKLGFRKVILSTNIAESSITIPDVKYVIDFCLTKNLETDRQTNYQSLKLCWASQSSLIQRKGRAGRVSDGECFRLINKEFYYLLDQFCTPELQRCPLEQVVLRVKLLELGNPCAVLQLAIQPPLVEDIKGSILALKEVGALTVLQNGKINPLDGDLTCIGRVLGSLPVDIRVGKLLVLGLVFGFLEECLVIGAALSLKSFFARPFKEDFEAYRQKMHWSEWSFSDCITILNAYKEWKLRKLQQDFGRDNEQGWGRKNFIQTKVMTEVDQLVSELSERLKSFNIQSQRHIKSKYTHDDLLIMKVIICGAFYPFYFKSDVVDEKEAYKTLSGYDPNTTVLVQGLPPPGKAYSNLIAKLLRRCGNGQYLYFENTRCFVEFAKPTASSSCGVLPEVYLSVKLRQLRIPMQFYVSKRQRDEVKYKYETLMSSKKTNRTLKSDRLTASIDGKGIKMSGGNYRPKQVPLKKTGYSQICVTEVVNAGHFWAHYGDTETFTTLRKLQDNINSMSGHNLSKLSMGQLKHSLICLALFEGEFYRARIEAINQQTKNIVSIKVFFVDYGNCTLVNFDEIRECPNKFLEVPFQAIECQLAHVRPRHGAWTAEANEAILSLIMNQVLIAKVFSVVRRVIRIDGYLGDVHLNQLMVEEGYAEDCEETYESKQLASVDDDRVASGEDNDTEAEIQQLGVLSFDEIGHQDFDDEIVKVTLRGPYSPYEQSVSSMTKIGHCRAAKIEQDSVCSVLICEEPQDKHPRFLVSAAVGVNASGNTLIARNCTLMPNIHGIHSIIPVIFAPYAEYRSDQNFNHYTGAICGLGFHPETKQPLFADHDIEIDFDVELTQKDITEINGVRTCLNLALGNDDMLKVWGSAAIERIQQSARENVLGLLKKSRTTVDLERFSKPYVWNQMPEHLTLNPYPDDDPSYSVGVPYALHVGIFLNEKEKPKDVRIIKMKEDVLKLHELAGRSVEPFKTEVVCPLCFVRCKHPLGLSLHMESNLHQLEEELLFKEKK